MESSSTTVNIAGNTAIGENALPTTDALGRKHGNHTHGASFGRYIAGCPACIKKWPNGPEMPKRNKVRKDRESGQIAILQEQIAALSATIQAMAVKPVVAPVDPRIAQLQDELESVRKVQARDGKSTTSNTDELVNIMLRREAKAIEKEEDTEARRLAAREDMLRIAQEQEATRAAMQANCGHVKENGRTRIFAQQIHNDGLVHPFCSGCGKTFPAFRPSNEMQPTSVSA